MCIKFHVFPQKRYFRDPCSIARQLLSMSTKHGDWDMKVRLKKNFPVTTLLQLFWTHTFLLLSPVFRNQSIFTNSQSNWIWVLPKIVLPPNHPFNRVFHYKPSNLEYPYCWKHPYSVNHSLLLLFCWFDSRRKKKKHIHIICANKSLCWGWSSQL